MSCGNDKETDLVIPGNMPPEDIDGKMYDGAVIDDVLFFCIGKSCGSSDTETKILNDYSNVKLSIETKFDNSDRYMPEDVLNRRAVAKDVDAYYKQRTAFIYSEYLSHFDKALNGWTVFLNAYINGKVCVTCDKVLFGEEAGTDLSKYFRIYSEAYCMPVGIENPKLLYNFGDEMPEFMCDFFPAEAWFQDSYTIEFASVPEEKYDELTFTLNLPLKIDYVRSYFSAKYRGEENAELQRKDKVFIPKCTVKFNW